MELREKILNKVDRFFKKYHRLPTIVDWSNSRGDTKTECVLEEFGSWSNLVDSYFNEYDFAKSHFSRARTLVWKAFEVRNNPDKLYMKLFDLHEVLCDWAEVKELTVDNSLDLDTKTTKL